MARDPDPDERASSQFAQSTKLAGESEAPGDPDGIEITRMSWSARAGR